MNDPVHSFQFDSSPQVTATRTVLQVNDRILAGIRDTTSAKRQLRASPRQGKNTGLLDEIYLISHALTADLVWYFTISDWRKVWNGKTVCNMRMESGRHLMQRRQRRSIRLAMAGWFTQRSGHWWAVAEFIAKGYIPAGAGHAL